MKDRIRLIKDLTNADGISGFEDEVVGLVREYAKDLAEVREDRMRNVFLYRKGNKGNRPVVMLDAHTDEIGFMVQSINGKGLIKFIPIGGWSPQNVSAHKVRIRNKRGETVKGVIVSKPPHFMSEAEKSASPKMENMLIDVGANSREEVVDRFGIEVGNPICPDVDFEYNGTNNVMCAKAFDDRIGVATVLCILDSLQGEELNVDVVCALSTQEEVGMRGAQVTSNRIDPHVALVFEGTPADDVYTGEHDCQAGLKKGPQVRHRDASMITHPRFLAFARKIAIEAAIPFQDAVREGGGTDAGAIHIKHNGVPSVVIGIPSRYIHTHYAYCAYEDFENAVKWGCEIVRRLDKEAIEAL
ncbi:MAG: M42 family metallopeptidase [Clostridia bacterium]